MPYNIIKPLQSAVSDINPRGFKMEEFSENSAWKNSEEFLIGNVIRRIRRLNMQMTLNHLVARRRKVLNALFLLLISSWFHCNETALLLCLAPIVGWPQTMDGGRMLGIIIRRRDSAPSLMKSAKSLLTIQVWSECLSRHMPKTQDDFEEKRMLDMDEFWQFPCCWAAIDGSHIRIKCSPGGLLACKEYHKFKNSYSILLMGLVDSHYRFVWGSCNFPGNSHDAVIFRSTDLCNSIQEGFMPTIRKAVGDITVLVIGDSALSFRSWLMRPFTNVVLTPQQCSFNYRLSRVRMVTEAGYAQLMGGN